MLAGMAAAQQMMISPEDLQQLLQANAAAQQPGFDLSAEADLLRQLQQVLPRSAHTCSIPIILDLNPVGRVIQHKLVPFYVLAAISLAQYGVGGPG